MSSETKPKRKAISARVRFEVFKRDSFTCQYCGQRSPNVILHVDHIDPVANGGTNDIVNLITSCIDCNLGKSDKELDDNSAVVKRHNQLAHFQERAEQIKMMHDWHMQLNNAEQNEVDMVAEYIHHHLDGYTLNASGKKRISTLYKKFGMVKVLEAVDIAADKYIKYGPDDLPTKDSVENFVKKIGGVANNKSKPEVDQKTAYIRGILRNRFPEYNERIACITLKNYTSAMRQQGLSDAELLDTVTGSLTALSKEASTFHKWKREVESLTDAQGTQANHDHMSEDELEQLDEKLRNKYIEADEPLNSICQIALDMEAEAERAIEAIDFIGRQFDRYDPRGLEVRLNRTVSDELYRLIDMIDAEVEDEHLLAPHFDQIMREGKVLDGFKPIDSMTKDGLSNAAALLTWSIYKDAVQSLRGLSTEFSLKFLMTMLAETYDQYAFTSFWRKHPEVKYLIPEYRMIFIKQGYLEMPESESEHSLPVLH